MPLLPTLLPEDLATAEPLPGCSRHSIAFEEAQPQPQRPVSPTRKIKRLARRIFRSANRVTRPEKEFITRFLAGARDNPSPELGHQFEILLSSNVKHVKVAANTIAQVIVEEHFWMDTNTGKWVQYKKRRSPEPEEWEITMPPILITFPQ